MLKKFFRTRKMRCFKSQSVLSTQSSIHIGLDFPDSASHLTQGSSGKVSEGALTLMSFS